MDLIQSDRQAFARLREVNRISVLVQNPLIHLSFFGPNGQIITASLGPVSWQKMVTLAIDHRDDLKTHLNHA